MARVGRTIDVLVDAVEATGITRSLRERLEQREAEREGLRIRIQELQAREGQEELRVSDEVLRKMLEDLEHGIQRGDVQDLRAFLSGFVKRIEVDQEGGGISYTFPFAGAVL